MIATALLLAAVAWIAYRLGRASERIENLRRLDLADDLERAAARGEWGTG